MSKSSGSSTGTTAQVSLTQNLPNFWLRRLVELVNQTCAEIPLTLTVGGTLISGSLVSNKSYVESLRREISAVCKDDEVIKSYQADCDKALDRYSSPMSEETPGLPHAIHLKNARYFLPGHKRDPGADFMWWSGLLSEVDGFSLGQLDED